MHKLARKIIKQNRPLQLRETKMEKKEEEIQIRLVLKGDLAKRFSYLKDRLGIHNNSELVRLLISQEYQRLVGSIG